MESLIQPCPFYWSIFLKLLAECESASSVLTQIQITCSEHIESDISDVRTVHECISLFTRYAREIAVDQSQRL